MGEFESIDEILEFAIARESEADEFYRVLAGRAANPATGELLLAFAKEEQEHKSQLELELIKRGRVVTEDVRAEEARELDDFQIADYVVDDGGKLDIEYEDLLMWGMKKEKASFRLYVELAAIVKDQEMRETLLALAEQEAKHKVQLEMDLDDLMTKQRGETGLAEQ